MSNVSKKKIALLFSSLASFEPEMDDGKWTGRYLVNESKVSKLGEPPDRDELLTRIGQASVEMKDYLQQVDIVARDGAAYCGIVMQVDTMLNGLISGLEDKDPVERMEILVSRYRQMYDTLHKIAYDIPQCSGKQFAMRFLQWKGQDLTLPTLTALVNQNSSSNGQKENPDVLADNNKPRPGDAATYTESSVDYSAGPPSSEDQS